VRPAERAVDVYREPTSDGLPFQLTLTENERLRCPSLPGCGICSNGHPATPRMIADRFPRDCSARLRLRQLAQRPQGRCSKWARSAHCPRPDEMAARGGGLARGWARFDDLRARLEKQGLLQASRDFIQSGPAFSWHLRRLQALFERRGIQQFAPAGLGIFQAKSFAFPTERPQNSAIGWNQLEVGQPECPLFRGITAGSYV